MHLRRSSAFATLSLACLFAASCGEAPQPITNATSAQGSPASSAPATNASGATAAGVIGPLTFDLPDGWVSETPSNSMRAAQFALPGGDGASLVVYFFGVGGGGGVQANLDRWINQVRQPDGSDSHDKAKLTDEERPGLKLHHVDVTGNFTGMDGATQEDWRLLGTVVECTGGPFFFKLTGPAATVEAQKANYDALFASLKATP